MRLRPLTQEDSKDVFDATHNDWTIHHALRDYFCETPEYAKKFVAKLIANSQTKPYAVLSDNNEFAGVLTVDSSHGPSTIEISSFISTKYRRKGYATLSLWMIFQMYPGYRVLFNVTPDNCRSLSIMRKIGAYKLNDDYYFVDTW